VNQSLPTAEEQLRFLQNLQRLLDEGVFVSTYKFALLLALADLAVEKGNVGAAPLRLTVWEIAEKFVGYYWRQVIEYPGSTGGKEYLHFTTDGEAAIVRAVRESRSSFNGSLASARRDGESWSSLVKAVGTTVRIMPLWKLQTVRGGVHDFLYPNARGGDSVELRRGVAFCLRVFHSHVQNLVQGAWTRWVRRLARNAQLLGHTKELSEFLFGGEREKLDDYLPLLRFQQKDCCFYCSRSLQARGEVDHFVPWVRYPLDLGHNFVLACRQCNGDKSDLLADIRHLGHWVERNRAEAEVMAAYFAEHGIAHDLGTTESVAQWAYGVVEAAGGEVWVGRGHPLVALDATWRSQFDEVTGER
jgi:hypothetical protein